MWKQNSQNEWFLANNLEFKLEDHQKNEGALQNKASERVFIDKKDYYHQGAFIYNEVHGYAKIIQKSQSTKKLTIQLFPKKTVHKIDFSTAQSHIPLNFIVISGDSKSYQTKFLPVSSTVSDIFQSLKKKIDDPQIFYKGIDFNGSDKQNRTIYDMGIQPGSQFLILTSGRLKWSWDTSLLEQEIVLKNQNMTLQKIGETHWFCAFSNKFFSKGKHSWRLVVDKFPSTDWAGLIYGICEASHNSPDCVKKHFSAFSKSKSIWAMSATHIFQMKRNSSISNPQNGDVFEFILDLNKGSFTIIHQQSGLRATTDSLQGRTVRPFVGVYYPDSMITVELN